MSEKKNTLIVWIKIIKDSLKIIFSGMLPCFFNEKPERVQSDESGGEVYKLRKVAFYIGCEDNRSERYRVHNIVEALKLKNYVVDIYRLNSIKNLFKSIEYDLFVIFREDRYRLLGWKKIEKNLRKMGIPIIYDTDDYTLYYEDTRSAKNILNIIKFADVVTVTTEYLADKFRNKTDKPVYVIKNTINYEQMNLCNKICKKSEGDKIRIVYQSGTATHDDDFKIVEKVLIKILTQYEDIELHIFGPLKLSDEFLPVSGKIIYHSYMDYLLLQIYVSEMDINIAPLEINDFNNSKSELKIFEAALLHIPTICSPISSYCNLIDNGVNGYIASTEEEWYADFQQLIENKDIRKSMGIKAYTDFVNQFYIDREINNVIDIYEKLIMENKNQRGKL